MPRDYSPHQQKIIKRYYDNREAIDTQRLSELCTSLYLASGKKLEKLWQSAEDTMTRIGVRESRVRHVVSSRDPAVLAQLVQDIEKGVAKLEPPKKTPPAKSSPKTSSPEKSPSADSSAGSKPQ